MTYIAPCINGAIVPQILVAYKQYTFSKENILFLNYRYLQEYVHGPSARALKVLPALLCELYFARLTFLNYTHVYVYLLIGHNILAHNKDYWDIYPLILKLSNNLA